MRRITPVLLLLAALVACRQKPADYQQVIHNPVLYSKVVGQLIDVVTYDIFTPPVASRIQAYSNLAAYEVMAHGDSNYISLQGQLKDLDQVPAPPAGAQIDYPFAATRAFIEVGKALTFSKDKTDAMVDSLNHLANNHGMPEAVFNSSTEYALRVAKAIMDWSKKDNYAETRSAAKYTVPNEEGYWVPTPPGYFQAVEPQWKTIRSIVLDSAGEFEPAPPTPYSKDKNSLFYKWVTQVYDSVNNLSKEQMAIANFWDCNGFKMNVVGHAMFATKAMTPGGHWMGITGIVSENKKADFSKTVYAYTTVSFGIMDGFISTWNVKYRWNLVRPETIINKYIDENWKPFLQTPPFPEYTSAHSTISGAAATVLERIYGTDTPFRDSTERPWGWADRSFERPLQAAREAAISRFYGGIHYRPSCLVGSDVGIEIGNKVMDKLKMKREQLVQR